THRIELCAQTTAALKGSGVLNRVVDSKVKTALIECAACGHLPHAPELQHAYNTLKGKKLNNIPILS
ncbi:hypothetical protein EON64_07240, partial [archaeon]